MLSRLGFDAIGGTGVRVQPIYLEPHIEEVEKREVESKMKNYIQCVIFDTLVPVFYILMTSKCRTLYDTVFTYIHNLYPGFKSKLCIVDFETALYSAIQYNFECRMQRCYFHYRQALCRNWSKLRLCLITALLMVLLLFFLN